tara:strand:- start:263 stop:478 length:216 start_codon:yes stop_codon:yes gene_type:complete
LFILETRVFSPYVPEGASLTFATIAQLHNLGLSLSLDDFGTGNNTFVKLNSSFITSLKIDKKFIQAINTDS